LKVVQGIYSKYCNFELKYYGQLYWNTTKTGGSGKVGAMYQGDDAIKPAQRLVACDVLKSGVVTVAAGLHDGTIANSRRPVA
jgi:hypothetical protein